MCFTNNFWSLTVDGLSNGFLYALIALGYTLVYGVLQLINFAHSEVFMAGGFAGLFMTQWLVPSTLPSGWTSVALVAAGTLAGAVVGGLVTFLLGGLLGGAAGFLFGMGSTVSYGMGFVPGIKAFTAAVLGGIGNIRGAMLGGIVLGLVENYGVACTRNAWRDVIAFGILVA